MSHQMGVDGLTVCTAMYFVPSVTCALQDHSHRLLAGALGLTIPETLLGNVPFHAVSFPATLLGSGEPWKTVDVIKGFHWLTYEGGKFSTSAQRGVLTDAALDELPADIWRWWLIANAPESADVDFNFRRFAGDIGKDLG